ncbi:hypothetical protein AVEN_43189-1, partial [Araneus ventricosus]
MDSGEPWTLDLGDKLGDHFGYLATLVTNQRYPKMLLLSRISIRVPRSRFFLKILCDVTAYRGEYKKTALGLRECRLSTGTTLEFSLQCWKAGELRAIETDVTVIISDLLTVCVSKSESAVTVITSDLLTVCVSKYESAVTVIISDLLTVCVSKYESAVTVIISDLLTVCV